MRQLILFLLIITTNYTYAQISSSIYYKVKTIEDLIDKKTIEEKDKMGALAMFNSSAKEYANVFNFKLNFNNKEALFKAEEQMSSDVSELKYKFAQGIFNAKKIYYLNNKTGIKLTQTNAFGQDFVISDSISNLKWSLTKDTKKIGKYLCYKATYTRKVVNSVGVFYKPVIAWYSAEFQYSFGPAGYGGLPGLILELQDDKIVYYVSKIEFNKNKTLKIRKPDKGKLVTEKQFQDIVMSTNVSFKN